MQPIVKKLVEAHEGIADEQNLNVPPRFIVEINPQKGTEKEVAEAYGYPSCQVGLEGWEVILAEVRKERGQIRLVQVIIASAKFSVPILLETRPTICIRRSKFLFLPCIVNGTVVIIVKTKW